jgi:hypothetical protein
VCPGKKLPESLTLLSFSALIPRYLPQKKPKLSKTQLKVPVKRKSNGRNNKN